ncbi:MAG: hypothetical protein N3E50_09790 [Candidatus Goldbacteria bacterium]|nr:hypothetical protein [Candidatus Goldiibacteriota bacterium]
MNEPRKIKISSRVEKVLLDFCLRKNKNIDEFIEEAILEKIDREELKEDIDIFYDEDMKEEIIEEYLMDEIEIYKKKH